MEQQFLRRRPRASDLPACRLFGNCSRTYPDHRSHHSHRSHPTRSTLQLPQACFPELGAGHAQRRGRASIGMAEGAR